MATPVRLTRQKISTTISSDTLSFLEDSIKRGEARTLAEAIDLAVRQLLVYQNRERLANDTAAYFADTTDEEAAQERRILSGTRMREVVLAIRRSFDPDAPWPGK